jgi:succinate dehydrogenase / fumarate reductase, membrane anchor subunit
MSGRTPYSRVEGLGASHSGTEHFWRERASAVALVPLTLWFAAAVFHIAGGGEEAAMVFLAQPLHAVLMILFVVATVIHMTMGIQVVIEDYVYVEGQKIALFLLNRAFGWLVGALCVFAILKIAL